jgi:hypothetical protein
MMQGPRRSRNIGMKGAVGAIVLALGVCGAWPAWAETHEIRTGNMVSFRGGFMRLNQDRGSQIFTDTGAIAGANDSNNGWFAGAALDMVLSKDAWGGMDKTWVMGEVGLQFNRIASQTVNNAAGSIAVCTLGGTCPTTDPQKVQLTMMTINVSPKIKFMEGSAFRPWVIPIGLDFHVISPPSNRTQYLDMGVQFGAGFEYQVWKAIIVGVDARYHVTSRMTNTNNDYFQVGPYLGIAF